MEEIKEKKKYIYPLEKIKEYNERFKLKHKDNIITCSICFKQYNELNYYHPRSKQHQIAIQLLQSLSTINANHES
jgi:RNA binding exosome subunit